MQTRKAGVALIGVALAAAGARYAGAEPQPYAPDGFRHVAQTRGTVPCDRAPLALDGSHSSLKALGGCRFVRVTGEHNDIDIEALPGATIEITGAHNDVTRTQTRPGPRPALVDRGSRNTFHWSRRGY